MSHTMPNPGIDYHGSQLFANFCEIRSELMLWSLTNNDKFLWNAHFNSLGMASTPLKQDFQCVWASATITYPVITKDLDVRICMIWQIATLIFYVLPSIILHGYLAILTGLGISKSDFLTSWLKSILFPH